MNYKQNLNISQIWRTLRNLLKRLTRINAYRKYFNEPLREIVREEWSVFLSLYAYIWISVRISVCMCGVYVYIYVCIYV